MSKFWRGLGALFIGLGVYNMTTSVDDPFWFVVNTVSVLLWSALVIFDND